MFERFSDEARHAVVVAQEEARLLQHGYIGTEHLLLALLSDDGGIAKAALNDAGCSLVAARTKVEEIVGVGSVPPTDHIPFTARAKSTLEGALREAVGLNNDYIGAEHILLGLLRLRDGTAVEVLANLGIDMDALREQVIALVGVARPKRRGGRHDSRGTVSLVVTPRRGPAGGFAGDRPDVCSFCGRELVAVERYVRGARAVICGECLAAAATAIASAPAHEVVLPDPELTPRPPKVDGDPPDATAVERICEAIRIVLGTWGDTTLLADFLEDPSQLDEILGRRREMPMKIGARAGRIAFVNADTADVHVEIAIDASIIPVEVSVFRRADRWVVSAESLRRLLGRL